VTTGRRQQVLSHLHQHIQGGLHLGLLSPGDRLLSSRALAHELKADPRVVRAAYHTLRDEGLVELRQRSGVYLAATAAAQIPAPARVAEWTVEVFRCGLAMDIPAPALPDWLRRSLATRPLRVVCLECNTDQLYSIGNELTRDYGFGVTGIELADAGLEERRPELAGADLLVTTAFHAQEVRLVAERLGKPWIAIALREDLVTGVFHALARGPLYFVVTDPRFARKLREIWALAPGVENLRTLILGEDDLNTIPVGAPVIIPTSARIRLGGSALLARYPGVPRFFASESTRELLAFMVQANLGLRTMRQETASTARSAPR
jgi:DNA-binding transcriptional regulator YhcF (GntR family)